MNNYSDVAKIVAPKKAKLEEMQIIMNEKNSALALKMEEL